MDKNKTQYESDKNEADNKKTTKRKYIRPLVQSEKLNSYGAVCNGTTVGGRKASTVAPARCSASKVHS